MGFGGLNNVFKYDVSAGIPSNVRFLFIVIVIMKYYSLVQFILMFKDPYRILDTSLMFIHHTITTPVLSLIQ